MVREARDGNLTTRARALTAHRVHVIRCAAGQETVEDAGVDAIVGGLLDAEFAHDVHVLQQSYQAVHKE